MGLTRPEQETVRQVLADKRAGTMAQIAALTRDLGDVIEASADVATDDEHDPEGATIAFEREQVSALLDLARSRLTDLDSALDRLDDGSYGMCEQCGQPIAGERLAARPSASTCIVCAERRR